ncbi:glycosyltransferase [Liquorilactobacillus capillatus]|nr:glycosyltransferase [Liquorilactobacillus capillatus]
MKRILILLSTFNGQSVVKRQVESIIAQREVDAHILVRDDGSSDNTLDVLFDLRKKYRNKIEIIKDANIGYRKSFFYLIQSAQEYDYYGFSDQDDLWMDDKVISCIKLIENHKDKGPKLAHVGAISVDENLKKRLQQEKRKPKPSSFKMAIATEYFQGCGMIWNKELMRIVRLYVPRDTRITHDYWVGLLGYLFGDIYFCSKPKFYHIRYKTNSSRDGNILLGRVDRLKKIFTTDSAYMNPAQDLSNGYSSLLTKSQKNFLNKLINYRKNSKNKISILFDIRFKRPTLLATLLFKFSILINHY